MNKRLITLLKVAILVVVAVLVGRALYKAWNQVNWNQVNVDWRWGIVAIAGFCGSMITAGTVWRWLAWKMGDRSRTLPLIGAYTFSQMGKYIPGKIALLLMRIERAGRFGMSPGTCTLSTLLENALYMVSGALVGMTAIVRIADQLDPKIRVFLFPVAITIAALLASACAPPVFYGLVNRLLARMKKPPVPREQWLKAGTLVTAVIAFVPCWLFGGAALWASAQCVHPISILDCWWFAGAYALSVIIGMASLLPGGAGIREAVLGAAAAMQFMAAGMPHANAVILGGVVAVLQRFFQVIVEVLLGVAGAFLTSLRRQPPTDAPATTI